MTINAKALELEMQSLGQGGAPTLGPAYELLRDQWRSGDRDRELALHLFFLAWYIGIEPPHLTGLDDRRVGEGELDAVISEVHDWLLPDGEASDDVESLYVVGLPAQMFPWVLGDEDLWTARGIAYHRRYWQLARDGLDPAVFEGRGAYGDYYGEQVRVVEGMF
jgi:hypothetical protein